MEDTALSSSFTPSWLEVSPQLVSSGRWLALGLGAGEAGETGDWARPGFLGGMGGGLPRSVRGTVGDRTPRGGAPEALEMTGEGGARLR